MRKKAYSNDQLIQAIKSDNDVKAIEQVYSLVFPKIKNYITKNGGDLDEAKDVFQEGIIVLYRHIKLGKFKEEYGIDGFLFKVCQNLWITRAKQIQHTTPFDEIKENSFGGVEILYTNIVDQQRFELIQNLFDSLGDRCKELLNATIYEDLSMKDIVEKMGFATTDAVKTKHYKCKQRLILKIKDKEAFKALLQTGI